MRKYAALIDIGDDNNRTIDRFGEAHIGNIALTQIDLRR